MTVAPNLPTLQTWPLQTFSFVPEVEIHSERLLISDDRRDKRKFTMGPMHYHTKFILELKKPLEVVHR
jgi:hypothetical protein